MVFRTPAGSYSCQRSDPNLARALPVVAVIEDSSGAAPDGIQVFASVVRLVINSRSRGTSASAWLVRMCNSFQMATSKG